MTTGQTRKLELIASDGQPETVRFIDELFARVETLERENRRLNRIVAGLIERDEQHPPVLDMDGFRRKLAKGIRSVAGRPVLVQSGADDPRD